MHRKLLLAVAAFAGIGAAAASPKVAEPPKRIVSLNLCADQYLLALADPGQITALTRFARDPDMSAGATAAAHIPMTRGSAEDVLALDPDLIVATPGRRSGTRAAIAKQKYPTLDLPSAGSYDAIVGQIRDVAKAVGHPERGEAMIRRMDAELAALPRIHSGRLAAHYQRRGYMTGTGTLIDDLMQRVGLTNLAAKLGKPALSQLTIEQLIAAHPDYLIVESASDRVRDEGTEMLHHPALRDIPRIRLPQAWTVCGGPAYVEAARSLTRQVIAAQGSRFSAR